MRLVIVGIGRMKAGPERELLERYLVRSRAAGRAAGFTAVEVVEIGEGRGRSAQERKREEARKLLAYTEPGTTLIAFDERGRSVSSAEFAATLGRARDQAAGAIALVIGGPDGLSEDVRVSAALVFGFGAATLPHQIVRVLVAEQTYRALTILSGHPYHRA